MALSTKLYAETTLPPMPACYPEMLEVVRDIGGRLNAFCRIDMYATTRGPVFGEFTFFPTFGKNYTFAADAWLGKLWQGREGCGAREPDVQLPAPLKVSA